MTLQEIESRGVNNGIPWVYTRKLESDEYKGSLYSEEDSERIPIGRVELSLIGLNSPENLDSHYTWHSLSGFYVLPRYRKKGFGKIMLEKITNFARGNNIAIVKRLDETTPEALQMLEDFAHFLESNGFQRFDDRTFYYTYDGEKVDGGGQNGNS